MFNRFLCFVKIVYKFGVNFFSNEGNLINYMSYSVFEIKYVSYLRIVVFGIEIKEEFFYDF